MIACDISPVAMFSIVEVDCFGRKGLMHLINFNMNCCHPLKKIDLEGNFCTFGNDLNFMLEIEHCCWDQLNAVIVKVDQFKTIRSVNNFKGMAI